MRDDASSDWLKASLADLQISRIALENNGICCAWAFRDVVIGNRPLLVATPVRG
jgi:hypothetical protein